MHRYPLKITRELTKEKAIELHRQLWNYIADESERTGKPVSKKQAFKHFGWSLQTKSLCWCCEYCNSSCKNCPIEWPGRSCIYTFGDAESPFHKLGIAYDLCLNLSDASRSNAKEFKKYLKEYIKYAREIANLPERNDTK